MRLKTTTDALNHTTTLDYTATSGSSSYTHTTQSVRKKISPPTETAPLGIVSGQTFDNNLRVATKIDAEGSAVAATTIFTYDANGNPLTVKDPRNNITTTSYDTRNRKSQTVGPAPFNQTTMWGYDAASNVLTVTRPDNTTEVNTYDAMNRVLTHKEGDAAHITTFTYYASGKMKTVKDARNNITDFFYNAADLKTQMLYPPASVGAPRDHQDYLYDVNHNLIRRQIANQSAVPSQPPIYQKFRYDCRNRKELMWWGTNSDPNVTNDDVTWANGIDRSTFTYDAAGRMLTAGNSFSIVARYL